MSNRSFSRSIISQYIINITNSPISRYQSLPLPLWSRDNIIISHAAGPVRSPVGSISWLRFFRGFPSTVRQMSGNLGHIRPRLSYGHHIWSKPYIIRLWTATVSDLSCSTWPSFNNKQQQWCQWRLVTTQSELSRKRLVCGPMFIAMVCFHYSALYLCQFALSILK